jgi:hypothetical protein
MVLAIGVVEEEALPTENAALICFSQRGVKSKTEQDKRRFSTDGNGPEFGFSEKSRKANAL